jgi:hypothetical protein
VALSTRGVPSRALSAERADLRRQIVDLRSRARALRNGVARDAIVDLRRQIEQICSQICSQVCA